MFNRTIEKNLVLIGAIAIVLFYLPMAFLSKDAIFAITHEDAFYESFSAYFFFFAGILLLYIYLKTKNRSIFYLLFALAFFFAAGEEISWGQRIFHFATPAFMKGLNAQGEFNIHNLTPVQHERGLSVSIKALLNFNRLFILFYIVYTILIPLANRYSSRLSAFFTKIRLPLVPLWFGALFVLNEVICKLVQLYLTARLHATPPVEEIKESLWALTLFLMGIYFIYEYQTQFALKRQKEKEVVRSA